MRDYIDSYIEDLFECLKVMDYDAVEQVIEELLDAGTNGKKVFIFGNGGSAATASHFANDLTYKASEKNGLSFQAIALTDNIPTITAIANDSDYEDVFAFQIKNFITEDDLAIGLSGSGNSENVLKAMRVAKKARAKTIGFSGSDGGRMKEIADICVRPNDMHYGRVEDAHLFLEHLITDYLRDHG